MMTSPRPSGCWSLVHLIHLVHPLKKAPPLVSYCWGGGLRTGGCLKRHHVVLLIHVVHGGTHALKFHRVMGLFGGDSYGYRTCMNN